MTQTKTTTKTIVALGLATIALGGTVAGLYFLGGRQANTQTQTQTPTPVVVTPGEKEFTLTTIAATGSSSTPYEAKVKMTGKWGADSGYQTRLIVSGKAALYGWDGKQMATNIVNTNCDTGIVTSTSVDDLGQVQGGPAECRFDSNNGYIYMSAKIRTISGKKTLIFVGYRAGKLFKAFETTPQYQTTLFPQYRVNL